MRRLNATSRFRKDSARLERRGLSLEKMLRIVREIRLTGSPPVSTRPHILIGDWAGHLECQIAPDWLLIYQVDDNEVLLHRTGTHSDLFG